MIAVAALGALAVAVWRGTRPDPVAGTAPTVTEQRMQPKIAAEAKGAAEAKIGAGELSAAEKNARIQKIRRATTRRCGRRFRRIRRRRAQRFRAGSMDCCGNWRCLSGRCGPTSRRLTAVELEDYEMRETTTGKNLAQRLAGLSVVEETRRAVFRLMRELAIRN